MSDVSTVIPAQNFDEGRMRRIPVDIEHLGVRLLLPVLAIGSFVLVFLAGPSLLESLIPPEQANVAAFALAAVTAIGTAYVGDYALKRLLPTRRALLVDDHYLVLRRPGMADVVLCLDERINMQTWRFAVPRRGRVPKGHWCLGLRLLQDEAAIIVYTFISPKEENKVEDFAQFTRLVSSRKTQQEGRSSLQEAGTQRRLLKAENERWMHGVEMAQADFCAFWPEIKAYGTPLGE